jgi:hypothetical protein
MAMHDRRDKRREGRALGLSVLLHGLAAPLFVALIVGVDDLRPEGPTATSGLFSISVIHRAAPAPLRPAPLHAPVEHMAALVSRPTAALHPKVVAAAQRHHSGSPTKTRRVAVIAPDPTPVPTPTHLSTAAPKRVAAAPASSAPENRPAPAPSAAAQVATEPPPPPSTPDASFGEAPNGGWGQNFREPIVMDDDALNDLRSHYRGAVAHVEVDEEGRATRVSVDAPGLDNGAVAEIQRRLLAMRYVPAESNGLRCAATLDIKV